MLGGRHAHALRVAFNLVVHDFSLRRGIRQRESKGALKAGIGHYRSHGGDCRLFLAGRSGACLVSNGRLVIGGIRCYVIGRSGHLAISRSRRLVIGGISRYIIGRSGRLGISRSGRLTISRCGRLVLNGSFLLRGGFLSLLGGLFLRGGFFLLLGRIRLGVFFLLLRFLLLFGRRSGFLGGLSVLRFLLIRLVRRLVRSRLRFRRLFFSEGGGPAWDIDGH